MAEKLEKYRWEEPGPMGAAAVADLADALDVPHAGAHFLISRGHASPGAARRFLSGETPEHDPFLFENMEKAVAAASAAIRENKRILVHGDYDVDGICATALLYEFLRGLTPHVARFLPDRRKDGYGLAARAIDWAIENRVGLFVSVDCGTSDGDKIARLQAAGIDAVVCDHHEFPSDDSARGIMLNPVRGGERYPFRGLCGTGVAFKLVRALEARGVRGAQPSDALVDLVALATVGDVAPLVDENRGLVRRGLDAIRRGERPGIAALKSAAHLDGCAITAGHIGFKLAPRLNAPGRVSSPKPALELLCARNLKESARLAAMLEDDNARRRSLTDRVHRDVHEIIERDSSRHQRGGFVLAGRDWDEGVIGIAAARVAEDFGKPALIISTAGALGKGSGRSVPGIHLKEQLDRCKEHLFRYGGHAQAVGFSIEPGRIDVFRDAFCDQLERAGEALPECSTLRLDAALTLGECSLTLTDFLDQCEPFGPGNPQPVWKLSGVTVLPQTRIVGSSHLKLHVAGPAGDHAEAIAFGWGRRGVEPHDLHGRTVDLAVSLSRGSFRDRDYVEIHVADMREAATGE